MAPHALDSRPLVLSRGHRVSMVSRSHGFTSRVVADGHSVGTLDEGAGLEVRMAPGHATLGLSITPDRGRELNVTLEKLGHGAPAKRSGLPRDLENPF